MESHTWGDGDSIAVDFNSTVDLYKMLVDVRFKLLAFVPTVTTIAVGVVAMDLDHPSPDRWLTVGLVGLIATMALVVYEVRNSLLHDCAIHRLKHLEQLLGFRPSSLRPPAGGVFGERPSSGAQFGVFLVKHDRALAERRVSHGVRSRSWGVGLGVVGWNRDAVGPSDHRGWCKHGCRAPRTARCRPLDRRGNRSTFEPRSSGFIDLHASARRFS